MSFLTLKCFENSTFTFKSCFGRKQKKTKKEQEELEIKLKEINDNTLKASEDIIILQKNVSVGNLSEINLIDATLILDTNMDIKKLCGTYFNPWIKNNKKVKFEDYFREGTMKMILKSLFQLCCKHRQTISIHVLTQGQNCTLSAFLMQGQDASIQGVFIIKYLNVWSVHDLSDMLETKNNLVPKPMLNLPANAQFIADMTASAVQAAMTTGDGEYYKNGSYSLLSKKKRKKKLDRIRKSAFTAGQDFIDKEQAMQNGNFILSSSSTSSIEDDTVSEMTDNNETDEDKIIPVPNFTSTV